MRPARSAAPHGVANGSERHPLGVMANHPAEPETVAPGQRKAIVMFLRPRRPLLGAAMLGGAALAGRASQRASYREADQEERIESLEREASAPPVAAAPSAASTEPSLVSQLKQLSDLKASGALSAEEFDAAKQKLLAG